MQFWIWYRQLLSNKQNNNGTIILNKRKIKQKIVVIDCFWKYCHETEASDDDSTKESEFENDYDDDDIESDAEAYELRSESVNSVLAKNTTIALYSPSNSLELFYPCKLIDFGVAIENVVDEYNHIIPQGSRYIECQDYQKQKETKSKIHYKLLPKKVYVFPTQVLSPLVNLIENNVSMIEDYQWLCGSL